LLKSALCAKVGLVAGVFGGVFIIVAAAAAAALGDLMGS
jgi:hypothetical protein